MGSGPSAWRADGGAAAVLLFVLAAVVGVIAAATLALHLAPETSAAGMAITLAALAVMPALVYWKRRESRRRGNAALAADAVQSAACAYLALIAFAGLTARALFHIGWFDPAAAFVAIPLLIKEGRAAWKGALCNCCNAC